MKATVLWLFLLASLEAGEALRPGVPVERALARGEAHRYTLALEAGQLAVLALDQQGIDVVLEVRSPDGRVLAELDQPTGSTARDLPRVLAREAGIYGLEVRPAEASEEAGRYRLSIETLRPATPEDGRRVEAEWTAAEAYRHYKLRRPEELETSLGLYRQALPVWRELGEAAEESTVLYRIGMVHLRRGDARAALSSFEETLAVRRRTGDRPGAVEALSQIGRCHRSLGDPGRALEIFAEALGLAREAGAADKEASVLVNQGLVLQETGRLQEALAAYQRAQTLYQEAGDVRREIVVLGNLGGLLSALGRPTEAADFHRRSLEGARRTGDRSMEAIASNNLGDLYNRLGRPRDAVAAYSEALRLFRELGDARNQGIVINNLGDLLNGLGAPEEARDLLLQALPLHREKAPQALTRINLSRSAVALGKPDEARRLLEEALALVREVKSRSGEVAALLGLGKLRLDQGEPAAAAELLEEALGISREIGEPGMEPDTLRLLGTARAALGQKEAAGRAFEEGLRVAEKLGGGPEKGDVLKNRARAALGWGNLEAARKDLEAALERYEALRAEVASERLRVTFLSSIREAYELYVEVLMSLHAARPGEGFDHKAFAAAERSKSRALLDFLAHAEVEVRGGDAKLLAEERRLRGELAARAEQQARPAGGGKRAETAAALRREIEDLTAEYRIVEDRLRAGDPRYAALQEPGIDVAGAQDLLAGDEVLLEYAFGEEKSWLWVITPGSAAVHPLAGRERIETLAQRVHQHLRTPAFRPGEERADLAELARLLLEPAAVGEAAGNRLIVVAEGALHYIPFAALPVEGPEGSPVPLVALHEVVSLPSAAVLREIRRAASVRASAEGDLAILADPIYEETDPRLKNAVLDRSPVRTAGKGQAEQPDILRSLLKGGRDGSMARLSWSRQEAEGIAAAAAGRDVLLALDFRAHRDLALSPAVARRRVLHFATHGILDADHPDLSGLALSRWDEQGEPRDGFLRLQDVYSLHLGADLVVLSGCETALGRKVQGEGLLGLTHGFLHAGARQVVASLWEVRDRATAELMQRFYQEIYGNGLRPAAALRSAQLWMRERREWRDPYYWAGFVVYGDWLAAPGGGGK